MRLIKNIKWLIIGHLTWKRGREWNRIMADNYYCHGSFAPPEKLISAYKFWGQYSPIGGC